MDRTLGAGNMPNVIDHLLGRWVIKTDLEAIKDEVQNLDPDLSQDDYAFQVAVLLMAAALVTGPDVSRLASFTKYPATFVAEISQRMRGAGLWKDGSVESGTGSTGMSGERLLFGWTYWLARVGW
jgi:hypothetical protein